LWPRFFCAEEQVPRFFFEDEQVPTGHLHTLRELPRWLHMRKQNIHPWKYFAVRRGLNHFSKAINLLLGTTFVHEKSAEFE
jgi:hypothetical protein